MIINRQLLVMTAWNKDFNKSMDINNNIINNKNNNNKIRKLSKLNKRFKNLNKIKNIKLIRMIYTTMMMGNINGKFKLIWTK